MAETTLSTPQAQRLSELDGMGGLTAGLPGRCLGIRRSELVVSQRNRPTRPLVKGCSPVNRQARRYEVPEESWGYPGTSAVTSDVMVSK